MYLLKISMGIRVNLEEEMKGLDIGEHEMSAYSESASEKMSLSME
jgi:ammonia channel protein AmtB